MEICQTFNLEIESDFEKLVMEYKNRRPSSYSSITIIVTKLVSFNEVMLKYQKCSDKVSVIHFLMNKMKFCDNQTKEVACVIFKKCLGSPNLTKILEEYPNREKSFNILGHSKFYVNVPEEMIDWLVFGIEPKKNQKIEEEINEE